MILFLTFLSLSLAACKFSLQVQRPFYSLTLPSAPTSFCKCICFSNSTIIPLDDSPTAPSNTPKSGPDRDALKGRSCNDCNKQFCLDYHLPICQGAKEEDVFTTCFQRDSTKDQLVVYGFIAATGSLLAWAAIKPWVQKWQESRAGYAPVTG